MATEKTIIRLMKNFLNQPFYLFIIRDYTVTPHKSHDTTFVRHQIDTIAAHAVYLVGSRVSVWAQW